MNETDYTPMTKEEKERLFDIFYKTIPNEGILMDSIPVDTDHSREILFRISENTAIKKSIGNTFFVNFKDINWRYYNFEDGVFCLLSDEEVYDIEFRLTTHIQIKEFRCRFFADWYYDGGILMHPQLYIHEKDLKQYEDMEHITNTVGIFTKGVR